MRERFTAGAQTIAKIVPPGHCQRPWTLQDAQGRAAVHHWHGPASQLTAPRARPCNL